LAPGQLDRRAGRQADGAQAGDEGKIEALVASIIGNVEESVVARFSAREWPYSSSSL
jgi:hypothetical protein